MKDAGKGTAIALPRFARELARKGNRMLRRLILAAAMGSLALSAAACNTVKGLGEDVKSVGQAGEDAIN